MPEASKKNIAEHLEEAGFELVFRDHDQPATEAYTKKIDGDEIEIEFLTDDSTRGDRAKNVIVGGVVAQPLRYLKLGLGHTLNFQTQSRQSGKVVSPGAWVFHKGLTFIRRGAKSKYFKDLYGIWYVTTQLREFSDSAQAELVALGKEHSSWFTAFRKNLERFVKNATPSDWSKLKPRTRSAV